MRICIITPSQLGSNPRVVKEANALCGAGHAVTVVCTRVAAFVEPRDQAVISAAQFLVRRLPFDRPNAWRIARLRQMAARALCRIGLARTCADAALNAMVPGLARAARAIAADLYIAHYPAALPAAARAAHRNGARYAFDAEDFHLGDLPDLPEHSFEKGLIKHVEGRYLPSAAFITAASPMIADAYAETYGVLPPATVLNVFPRTNAPARSTASGAHRPSPTLYWFSQVIGPERGLETALRALPLTRAPLHLHLRGTLAIGYEQTLRDLAAALGVANRLHLHAPIAPDALERDAVRFDLGYAGDLAETVNRGIALTNKLFSYLTSGLPILASDIPAHRELAPQLGQAAELFVSGDPTSLAAAIDRCLASREALAARRRQAWDLGQSQFAWELEADKVIQLVQSCQQD